MTSSSSLSDEETSTLLLEGVSSSRNTSSTRRSTGVGDATSLTNTGSSSSSARLIGFWREPNVVEPFDGSDGIGGEPENPLLFDSTVATEEALLRSWLESEVLWNSGYLKPLAFSISRYIFFSSRSILCFTV